MNRLLLLAAAAVFVWSGIRPHDRFTWFLEVLPAVLALGILLATRHRFPLSRLLYVLITIHAIILMVGGRYTYAEVPLGFWMQDWFGFSRNHYDRIGHFAQGFIPAMVAREILLRLDVLQKRGAWLFGIICAICLAISALYELLEWAVAAASGTAAEAFLGTQGDVWDTQTDMLMALLGAMCALALLSRVHDRSMQALQESLDAEMAAWLRPEFDEIFEKIMTGKTRSRHPFWEHSQLVEHAAQIRDRDVLRRVLDVTRHLVTEMPTGSRIVIAETLVGPNSPIVQARALGDASLANEFAALVPHFCETADGPRDGRPIEERKAAVRSRLHRLED